MPRVHHVKSARKDNPVAKRGEPYYWWKFRFGGKCYSLTPPTRSQLTQSGWLSTLYDLQDSAPETTTVEDCESWRDDVVSQLDDLMSEAEESREAMPEGLQESPVGEMLQCRYDSVSCAKDDIECMDLPEPEDADVADDADEDAKEDAEEAVQEQLDSELNDFVSNVQSALSDIEEG